MTPRDHDRPKAAFIECPSPACQAWAEVDLARLRGNLDYVRAVVPPPAKIMAVVKADAYGHGAATVARTAVAWGCEWLGAGNASEGLELRAAGLTAPCLVLAPVLRDEIEPLVRARLALTVSDFGIAGEIARIAQQMPDLQEPPEVHLLVDAGIGRFGVRPRLFPQLAEEVDRIGALRLGGVYTHFAEPLNTSRTASELAVFVRAVRRAEQVRGRFPLVHAAASEAAVMSPDSRLDMVRIGNLMYGYWAGPLRRIRRIPGKELKPAWTLKARVIAIRELARGQGMGYGENRATHPMRVAVLPVGISDGVTLRSVQASAGPRTVLATLLKELARSAVPRWRPHVVIRGARAPLVGQVGMQFTLVDITPLPDIQVGDEASIPGVRATAAGRLPHVYLGDCGPA